MGGENTPETQAIHLNPQGPRQQKAHHLLSIPGYRPLPENIRRMAASYACCLMILVILVDST